MEEKKKPRPSSSTSLVLHACVSVRSFAGRLHAVAVLVFTEQPMTREGDGTPKAADQG